MINFKVARRRIAFGMVSNILTNAGNFPCSSGDFRSARQLGPLAAGINDFTRPGLWSKFIDVALVKKFHAQHGLGGAVCPALESSQLSVCHL